MRRYLPLSFAVLVTAAFLGLAGVNGRAEDGATAIGRTTVSKADAYRLVAPLDVLMEMEEDMLAVILEKVDKAKFRSARRYAYLLAEISNICIYAEYDGVDTDAKKKEWRKYTETARDGLVEMAQAAKKKDAERVKAIHSKVDKTCESCHDKFRD